MFIDSDIKILSTKGKGFLNGKLLENLDETIEYLLNSTIIKKDDKITLRDCYTFFEHASNYIQTRNYKIETIIKWIVL